MSKTKDQRCEIVNKKINGNAALFTACQQGKVHFVNFLLEECKGDIELKGKNINQVDKQYNTSLHKSLFQLNVIPSVFLYAARKKLYTVYCPTENNTVLTVLVLTKGGNF